MEKVKYLGKVCGIDHRCENIKNSSVILLGYERTARTLIME